MPERVQPLRSCELMCPNGQSERDRLIVATNPRRKHSEYDRFVVVPHNTGNVRDGFQSECNRFIVATQPLPKIRSCFQSECDRLVVVTATGYYFKPAKGSLLCW